LRAKLQNVKGRKEKSTKYGKGAKKSQQQQASQQAGSRGTIARGAFQQLSISQIEEHIQRFSLRFIDLIICCMVVDNYSEC